MSLGHFLLNDSGNWRHGSTARIFSAVAYPFDPISREQLFQLFQGDYERGNGFEESEFVASVTTSIYLKGLSRRAMAGLVTLVFFEAAKQGCAEITQYRATQLAESIVKEALDDERRPLTVTKFLNDGSEEVLKLRVTKGRQDIERCFREFQLISPLTAAMLTFADEPEQRSLSKMDETARRILLLAASIDATVTERFANYYPKSLALEARMPPSHRRMTPKEATTGYVGELIRKKL